MRRILATFATTISLTGLTILSLAIGGDFYWA